MFRSRRVLAVAALLLLVACGAAFAAEEEGTVDVKVVLSPPPVTTKLQLEIVFYRIEWNNEKGMNEPISAISKSVRYDPANPTKLEADFELAKGVVYQLVVDGINADGRPWRDATYYYAPTMFGGATEKQVALQPGKPNVIPLELVKGARDRSKGNFLDLYTLADGDYVALYVQPDQVSDLLYADL